MGSPTQFRSVSSLSSERILTLPPAHDRTSLSSFGGEGWGEEAALSESYCRPGLQTRRCPSPQPSPRARLAGRGRNLWWQCQDALGWRNQLLILHTTRHAHGGFPLTQALDEVLMSCSTPARVWAAPAIAASASPRQRPARA